MGYRVGEQAGPYEILKLLGRGTFGEVLLARDPQRPAHHIALKTVACDQLEDDASERARQSAMREAQLLIRLRHPYIVRCEQVQWDAERRVVWLALEFMDGGDVQGQIDKRRGSGQPPFEAHFVRRVFAAVGSALQYVHAEGVLHRDVKPANVLLARRSQRIKLGDFGISKLLEATGRAHTVVGTPYYLAPEVVSGQAYGPGADAWALGVCLFELAALKRPFEANNPLALVRRICEMSPEELPAETAPDVRQAIMGLLVREQQQRLLIADALEVSDAIAALAGPTTSGCSSLAGKDISQGQTSQCQTSQCSSGEPTSWELSPASQEARSGEGSPVSAVSMQNSESGCSSCPSEAEIVASLCAPHRGQEGVTSLEYTLEATGASVHSIAPKHYSMVPASWQGADAMVQAQMALSSDVDDPHQLKEALEVMERNAPLTESPAISAFEALRAELRLRLSALRANAASFLETLLEPRLPHPASPVAALPFRLAPGWRLLAPGEAGAPIPAQEAVSCAEVTTFMSSTNMGASQDDDDMAALETAIEEASCLGMDTSLAEEHAASRRGLLSLLVVWGSTTRCCLVPIGMPFASIIEEVACRFGVSGADHPKATVSGSPPFKLSWHNGVEICHLRDQVCWDSCLHQCGLQGRPGRLELRLEVPFVITGRRVASPCTAGSGVCSATSGARGAVPSIVSSRRPKGSSVRPGGASLHRAPVQRRRAGGGYAAALELQGHSARAVRGSVQAAPAQTLLRRP